MSVYAIPALLVIVAIAYALHWREKTHNINTSLEKAQWTIEDKSTQIQSLRKLLDRSNETIKELDKYKHCICEGAVDIQIKTFRSADEPALPYCVSVVSVDTKYPDMYFVIRNYDCDPTDIEDCEFAIRNAEELIEKIQA